MHKRPDGTYDLSVSKRERIARILRDPLTYLLALAFVYVVLQIVHIILLIIGA